MLRSLDRLARRHGTPRWRAGLSEAFVRAWRRPFLRELLRPFAGSARPAGHLFIVGCYNSGTTVVNDVLRAHPDASGPPVEGDLLTAELGDLEDGGFPRGLYANADTVVAEARRRTLDADRMVRDWAPWIRPGTLFVEKSISNSMRMEALRRAFPGVRFLWVLREPEEVVAGIARRSRPASGEPYTEDFLLRQWHFINRAIEGAWSPDDGAMVTYRELLDEPVVTARRLYVHAGLREVPVERTADGIEVEGRPVSIRGRSAPMETPAAQTEWARWKAKAPTPRGEG